MDAGGEDARALIVTIHDSNNDAPTRTHEQAILMKERMVETAERLEADFNKVHTKIPRFPRGLLGIGGDDGRYIAPSVVAIGPYHHGSPELQKMEEVKLAAAHHLCIGSGHSPEAVYEKVLSVAGEARGCYDADDPSVRDVADFAAMMFLDGCFLLQYMMLAAAAAVDDDDDQDHNNKAPPPVLRNRMTLSTGPTILKDIFLLENQIPWLVLQTLTEFITAVDVRQFVDDMGKNFFPAGKAEAKAVKDSDEASEDNDDKHTPPPHLLGLLRFSQVSSMPLGYAYTTTKICKAAGGPMQPLYIRAVELPRIAIAVTPSTASWFGDIVVRRARLSGELSLSPVFLNEVTACWLVNMAALEASVAAAAISSDSDSDGFVVTSYLSMLAMLMDEEEDVDVLRGRGVLLTSFSNAQAMGFFKGLGQHLRFGARYLEALEAIGAYRRHMSGWITTYRFVYINYRIIAALVSAAGVLGGLFQTLLSLKHELAFGRAFASKAAHYISEVRKQIKKLYADYIEYDGGVNTVIDSNPVAAADSPVAGRQQPTMATAAASSVSAGFSSTPSTPLRTGSRNCVSFPRRSPPATIALSVSAPPPAPPAANPKYHNAKADAGDEEVNGEDLLQRFTREVARARVMEEIRRRRRHEDARDRRKRKARSAARRHFKGPFDDDQGAKERMTDDDKNDNWELPGGKLPSYR
ncbi:hypothetical protein PR202_gb28954 [Eleusine coracana subsp. coracana]|uniref:Uncharacterized protein n=1 Tax=Eleusine coracana subsp. coracana TaxID=191504 RepID=A0AAV5G037_ELECO|nr:hypothetical protein PR202_gb28954 [Eleusine coracana subsp. coracana]